MPKKKPEKPVLVKHWRSKMYNGYVSDVDALLGTVKELNIEADIDAVLPALDDKFKSLPENDAKRTHLEKLIAQLNNIKNFATEFRGSEELINIVFNWDKVDSDKAIIAENDERYSNNVNSLMEHVSQAKALMYNNSVPSDIKANLDNYNALDGYADYVADNSAFLKLDDIFRKTMKLFTQATRIDFLVDKYRAEKDLEDKVDYDKKNLIEYGKDSVNIEGFSISGIQEKFRECLLKGSDYRKAVQAAEKEMTEAKGKLDKLKADRNTLIDLGKKSGEEKRAAEQKYNETRTMVESFKRVKTSLKDTFAMEIPVLDGMEEARNKKYETFSEMADNLTKTVEELSAREMETNKKKESIRADITYAIENGDDTRLSDFNSSEGKRYGYKKYPVMAREIVRILKALPPKVGFDPSIFNIMQVEAEVKNRIKNKVGDSRMWYSISCMLKEAITFAPGNFASMNMSEESFVACEKEGAAIIEKIENDKIHTLLKEIKDLEENKATFMAIEARRESVAKEKLLTDPKKKDKRFWEQYKKEKQTNDASLKDVIKKISSIKNSDDYIRGSSSIEKMAGRIMEHSDMSFELNKSQVDMFITLYDQESKNISTYKDGIEVEKKKIYDKLYEIYQSVPDDAYLLEDKKTKGKHASPMHNYLEKMKPPVGNDIFKKNYELFIREIDYLKGSYSDQNEKKADEYLNNARLKLESFDYEARISALNTQISQATEEYSTKLSDYEQKKNVLSQNDQNFTRLRSQVISKEEYYKRKEEAESFDPENERLNEYKTEIKGTNFIFTLKQPFEQLYAKREMAKKRGHQDSPEFERMRDALSDVVKLANDTDIAAYKQALSTAKDFATRYLTKKESQFFVSKRSSMRKFRLSYARDIISLCEDQMEQVDGNEFGEKLSPAVEAYLSRTAPIEVKELSEEEKQAAKKAYNDSLDERAEEAKKAYLSSNEYQLKLAREVQNIVDELKDIEEKAETQNNILKNVDLMGKNVGNIINDEAKKPKDEEFEKTRQKIRLNTQNTIEQLNKRREELVRRYQHNKMLQAKNSLSEADAVNLTKMMENMEKDRKQSEIEIQNIKERKEELIKE